MIVYFIFKIYIDNEKFADFLGKSVELPLYMALSFRDLKCENRLCTLYIFSLSSNVMFGLLSFAGQVIADNNLQVALDAARTISHSLNAAVVLQQLYWIIVADLNGVDW